MTGDGLAQSEPQVISINDLIRWCGDAAGHMGMMNPHRELLVMCAVALVQLQQRLSVYEPPDNPQEMRVQ